MLIFVVTQELANARAWVLNNPYPGDNEQEKIYYSSFTEQPKTLDPAKSYSSNEYQFLAQIYEPLLQYDYFIRPYQLVPLLATHLPKVRYLKGSKGETLTIYRLNIKPRIFYQPHPALAKDNTGAYIYLELAENYLKEQGIRQLNDFPHTGTREVIVDDYIYQIKRLANPAINSPIYGLMSEYILGFRDFSTSLPQKNYVDLRNYSLKGVKKINDYSFEITTKGEYPQFLYWLAMPFFAPIPWEADRFYAQPGMTDNNLSFSWYPIGTGPFMLSENNPNRRMILILNPNFRKEFFPKRKDKQIPFVKQARYTLEKESIPRWNKFLQGYYDLSGIGTDSFDQAIRIRTDASPELSSSMKKKQIYLMQMTDPSIYYLGFNMLDSVVGGISERARKLRLAISIAVNFDENISIFYNGRGTPAQGPIPPGIFGYREGKAGINPYIYTWEENRAKRRSLKEAKQLMQEAGYPNGIDPRTDRPLILHYDVPITGGPDDKSQLDWMRKQFARIGIELNIRATQYNRFQDKMLTGNAQIFSWGWNADYPDPENFLFMLYSKNGKVRYQGENATNYENPSYDELFELMRKQKNGKLRQKLIDRMVEIVRHDAPLVWGINTNTIFLSHSWVSPIQPNAMSLGGLKYLDIEVNKRNLLRATWNKPVLWPLGVFFLCLSLVLFPVVYSYYKKEKQPAPRIKI